jgi:hypothetical protein
MIVGHEGLSVRQWFDLIMVRVKPPSYRNDARYGPAMPSSNDTATIGDVLRDDGLSLYCPSIGPFVFCPHGTVGFRFVSVQCNCSRGDRASGLVLPSGFYSRGVVAVWFAFGPVMVQVLPSTLSAATAEKLFTAA